MTQLLTEPPAPDESGRRGAPGKEKTPAETHLSLTEKAYIDLEEMIVTLRLAPGSAVSESGLSAALGIGRTPIREALQRLARERLVMILPQRGIIVSGINIASQFKLLEVRRELERLIARSAARRATEVEINRFRELALELEQASLAGDETTFLRLDREFNQLAASSARNEFLSGAMALISPLSRRFWYIHYQEVADMPLAARLHANVARAIAERDPEKAANASDALLAYLEEFTRATLDAGI